MYLEDSNGRIQENPSPSMIHDTLEQIGGSLDHCILSLPNDSFVQAAGAPGRLFVQYGQSDALFESSRTDLDVATVHRIFTDAMAGNDAWKTEFGFQPAGGAPGGVGASGTAQATAGTRPGGATGMPSEASLKDQILGSVRQQAGREVSYSAGRIARRVIRKLFGGR